MSPPKAAENRPILQPRGLRAGCHYLNQQTLVAPKEGDVRDFRRRRIHKRHGSNTLLLVATENISKINILKEKLRGEMTEGELVTRPFKAETCALQLYNKMGIICLLERIGALIEFVSRNSHVLEEDRIGTVVVGAIGNYIQTSSTDTSGADFGLVILYNANTQCVVQGTSRGVPVEGEYLQEARSGGFWDKEKSKGKIIYGSILKKVFHTAAQRELGADYDIAKDWHRVVCGVSRESLLKDVVQTLGPIL